VTLAISCGAVADELAGQVALVTGGGRGIGASIARELAEAGMRVAVAARTREQVERVAEEIGGLALEVDVSDEASVRRMVEAAEREVGAIDLLVDNAGIGVQPGAAPVWEDEDAGEWWRVFNVLSESAAPRRTRPRCPLGVAKLLRCSPRPTAL